jgi:hypothetical protein
MTLSGCHHMTLSGCHHMTLSGYHCSVFESSVLNADARIRHMSEMQEPDTLLAVNQLVVELDVNKNVVELHEIAVNQFLVETGC